MKQGVWIFVSHSHRDLNKVRKIRDYLEQQGGNPLLFYLKCLNDDDLRLPELISEEIKARDWFVLCDSPNARASKYVSAEIELVKSEKSPKTIVTIDLAKSLPPQFSKLDSLIKRGTTFLSYAHQDRKMAEQIRISLQSHDFRVWAESDIKPGAVLSDTIHRAIDEAVLQGYVLVLLSQTSLDSHWCKEETEYAFQCAAKSEKSNVIPVIIDPSVHNFLPYDIARTQVFDLTTGSFETRMKELIEMLKTREME